MKPDILIMNFSHTYERERSLLSPEYLWIDCTSINGTNCYCDPQSAQEIKQKIDSFSFQGIHLIDSGNYHYLTKFWTDKIQKPFSLVVFDHHPDMQEPLFDGILSCGSWVRDMLQSNSYLKKVVIVGASETLRKQTIGFEKRIYFFGEEYLHHQEAWEKFSTLRIHEPVYISLDKDVLSPKYAISDWDQGSLSLVQLKKLLDTIINHETVLGIDICGDCSHENPVCPLDDGLQINETTNHELIHFIEKAEELHHTQEVR